VVTHDFVPSTVRLVKAGVVDFAIGQDPVAQAYLPVKILHAYLSEGKAPAEPFIRTRIDIRTEDNIDEGGHAVADAGDGKVTERGARGPAARDAGGPVRPGLGAKRA
jgi:ABC-type sugar transport system substrate-binding protein